MFPKSRTAAILCPSTAVILDLKEKKMLNRTPSKFFRSQKLSTNLCYQKKSRWKSNNLSATDLLKWKIFRFRVMSIAIYSAPAGRGGSWQILCPWHSFIHLHSYFALIVKFHIFFLRWFWNWLQKISNFRYIFKFSLAWH